MDRTRSKFSSRIRAYCLFIDWCTRILGLKSFWGTRVKRRKMTWIWFLSAFLLQEGKSDYDVVVGAIFLARLCRDDKGDLGSCYWRPPLWIIERYELESHRSSVLLKEAE